MNCVFAAETTILVHLESVRIVLLVFHCVVVALLALSAGECNFYSHDGTSRFTEIFDAIVPVRQRRPPSDETAFLTHNRGVFA